MKITAFVLALALASQPAAARAISEIAFSGKGFVTASGGNISVPPVGAGNNIDVLISFQTEYGDPYINEYASGTFPISGGFDTVPVFRDSFITINFGGFTTGSITLKHGQLVDFYISGVRNEEQFLTLNKDKFSGQVIYRSGGELLGYQYDGDWALGQVRITTVVVPEPANWARMIAGFGLVGGTFRTRRRLRPESNSVRSKLTLEAVTNRKAVE